MDRCVKVAVVQAAPVVFDRERTIDKLHRLTGEAAQDPALAALLIDPQTAGGLLAGVPADRATDCLAELQRLGYRAAEIGVVAPRSGGKPRVSLEAGCVRPAGAPLAAVAHS